MSSSERRSESGRAVRPLVRTHPAADAVNRYQRHFFFAFDRILSDMAAPLATWRSVTSNTKSLLLLPIAATLLLGGCATPVGVTHIDIQNAYRMHTESALSAEQPSESSKMLLRRQGMLDRFDAEPAAVLAELHRGLGLDRDEDRWFALAELSFLHADRTGDRAYFLASALYAWALLFPDDASGTPLRPSDPRFRLAYDVYNQAIAKGLAVPGGEDEVRLAPGTYPLPFGSLKASLDQTGMVWGGYRLDRFISTTTLEVRGLRNRYRAPGLGAPLAASLAEGPARAKVVGSERLGPLTKVPVTALLRFDKPRAALAGGPIRGRIEVYAADQVSAVQVNGREQPLESDPTATLAYQLDKSPLYAMEIAGFLRGGMLRSLFPQRQSEQGIYFLHPFRPGRIPVVLVHGTASSPARWAELANELEGDPRIRDRFQLWFYIYDSGNPIGLSASRLRTALQETLLEVDPAGKDPALREMVVIGHSQGGLLTKLMAVDSGTKFWDRLSDKPIDALDVDANTKVALKNYTMYSPLPFIQRVVFIATPHHGALLAGGRIGAIAASLVTLPLNVFGKAVQAAAMSTLSKDERLVKAITKPPTAVDNMNPDNPALKILGSLQVDPRIKAHSIICVAGDGPKETGDDGVVAYRSAHIPEAVSERVVRHDHSCQGEPETIEEVRRILLEQAALSDGRRP